MSSSFIKTSAFVAIYHKLVSFLSFHFISFFLPVLRFFLLKMKFNAAIAAALLAASSVTATPFTRRCNGPNCAQPACPVGCIPDQTNPVPIPSNGQTIKPSFLSLYNVGTGAIDFDVANGKIFKADTDGGKDITTLVTFDFPAASNGKTCYFSFDLDTTATLTGSGLFDVFTSLQPATADTTSWGPGNQRNQNVGRMKAAVGAQATWVAQFLHPFPCPTGTQGYELVGVYDNDDLEWSKALAGPTITYS